MSYFQGLQNFIKKFDLFSHQTSFHYDDDVFYKSVFGGCASLLFIGFFIGIFFENFLKTLNK